MTPAFVGTVGLTLVLLVMATNMLAVHYARGVMQSAVEEGGRQGVAAGTSACQVRAASVISGGLGAMAAEVEPVVCAVGVEGAVVSTSATFRSWLPVLPSQTVEVRARVAARPAGP